MKKRMANLLPSLHKMSWKFRVLMVLPFAIIGCWLLLPPNDYPKSDVIINPSTGEYDAALESWVVPITTSTGDSVYIDLGDRGGLPDTIESDVLFVLSPILRTHPFAREFTVRWELQGGSTFDPVQELVFHRDYGELFHHRRWWFDEKLHDKNELLATEVKDRQIHSLAAQGRPFSDLANKWF